MRFQLQRELAFDLLGRGIYFKINTAANIYQLVGTSVIFILDALLIILYNQQSSVMGHPIGNGDEHACLQPAKYQGLKLYGWYRDDNTTNPSKFHGGSASWYAILLMFITNTYVFLPILNFFKTAAFDMYSNLSLLDFLDNMSETCQTIDLQQVHSVMTYQDFTKFCEEQAEILSLKKECLDSMLFLSRGPVENFAKPLLQQDETKVDAMLETAFQRGLISDRSNPPVAQTCWPF